MVQYIGSLGTVGRVLDNDPQLFLREGGSADCYLGNAQTAQPQSNTREEWTVTGILKHNSEMCVSMIFEEKITSDAVILDSLDFISEIMPNSDFAI